MVGYDTANWAGATSWRAESDGCGMGCRVRSVETIMHILESLLKNRAFPQTTTPPLGTAPCDKRLASEIQYQKQLR